MLVDRQQIKQVMMNLAMNAMDAMAKTGGRLTVTTRRVVRLDKSGWVQIEVADTGCGIAPEDLPHVFDPFFTTKHESTEHVGTGLGLSIVHQIIQEHGGTVEARSTVGKGTSFLITLPEGRTLDRCRTCFIRMARRRHDRSPYPYPPIKRPFILGYRFPSHPCTVMVTSTVFVAGLHQYPSYSDTADSERTACQRVVRSRFEALIDSYGFHRSSKPCPARFDEWLRSSLLASA